MLIMKSEERKTVELKLTNQKSIRILGEKENYKHLEMVEADTNRDETKKKKKKKKGITQKNEKIFKTKLCSRNLIEEIKIKNQN